MPRRFVERFRESLEDGSFVRLVLSTPTPAAHPLRRIEARLIDLRGASTLSLTEREPTRDTTRNLPPSDADAWLQRQLEGRFRAARLETTHRDWQLDLAPHRPPRLVGHKPRATSAPSRTHDRAKASPFSNSAHDWLSALGFLDAQGRPRASRTDKHRQILRFAEVLSHLVRDLDLDSDNSLEVADMGCGRGYLTFATWQLLRRELGLPAVVLGIESRESLVTEAVQTVVRLQLEGLAFLPGSIADTDLPNLDILLALHACNTATDDAIRRGIDAGCRLILVAPCCHQELRPQLGTPEPLGPVLAHGLLAGRMAEWLTDGLRILFLEWAGYRVKAIEFVDPEHTPRNLLLAAVRAAAPFTDPARRDRVVALKTFFGIRHHALDPLLEP